jgi:GTPase SAR1 family protein
MDEAQTYAKKLGLAYVEVSAKTAQNVNAAFDMITEKILDKIEKKEINPEEELGIKMGNKGEDPQTLSTKVQTSSNNAGGGLKCCGN